MSDPNCICFNYVTANITKLFISLRSNSSPITHFYALSITYKKVELHSGKVI